MYRYELKLVTQAYNRMRVASWLRVHPEGFVREHESRQVNSLYFDTPSLECFNDNLRGGAWRQKLRLRWYGQAERHIVAQLELKRKRGLLGDKKRVALTHSIDLTHSWQMISRQLHRQLPIEWQLLVNEAIRPMLLNRYQREYFVSRDGAIRATLDYQQVAFDQRITLRPQTKYKLPLANQLVIELKANEGYENRLSEAMSHFPIPRTRNSKYINGVLSAFQ